MNISFQRRTDLALSALRALREAGGRMTGTELAERVETTTSYLPQVIAPLVRAGWVTSDRGPRGGYQLTGEATGITLLDVIDVTEGPRRDGRCVLRDAPCPGEEACPVHTVWVEARRVLVDGFGTIAVFDNEGALS
jgi:Rrf2 family protein